jgi:hypothetical protein
MSVTEDFGLRPGGRFSFTSGGLKISILLSFSGARALERDLQMAKLHCTKNIWSTVWPEGRTLKHLLSELKVVR